MTVRSYRKLVPMILASMLVGVLSSLVTASPPGQAAADEVSFDSYHEIMDLYLYTHVGDNRGFGAEHDLARSNIAMLFESYGLSVTLEPFQYGGSTYFNVVGTKLGTVYPDTHFILGAHFDSVDNPGADDDASGTALIIEAARVLSQYPSDYTIKFVAFDREEQGLHGSSAYVDAHLLDDIMEMIQADMVAYDPGTNHARIYGDGTGIDLKTGLVAAVAEYGDVLTAADYGWNGQSDHAPFANAGIPACLLIEGEVWNNPYYHTQDDNFENPNNLNFDYAVMMTRAVVGCIVDRAGVQVPVDALYFDYPDGRPEYVEPDGGTRLRVQVTAVGEAIEVSGSGMLHYDTGAGWQSTPMEVVSAGEYDAVFPAAPCPEELRYYVSAEAESGDLFRDPYGAPDTAYSAIATFDVTVAVEDDMETDPGWTVENVALEDGAWNRGVPAGGGDRGDPAADFDGSGQCWLTDNVAGNSDVDGGPTRLISPIMDLSALDDPYLSYARWFTNDDNDIDRLDVHISDDGGAEWSLVESVAHQGGWSVHTFRVVDFATPTDQVLMRFSATDNPNDSVTEAAIDALQVIGYDCGGACAGDVDFSGDVGFPDLLAVLAMWGDCPPGSPCPEDLDGDLVVGFTDLLLVLQNWGPCP